MPVSRVEFNAFSVESALPLRGRDYHDYLIAELRSARLRLWASIFIVDVNRATDPDLLVRTLLKEVAAANARGLDVRMVIGDSKQALGIRHRNRVARAFLRNRGVEVRRYAAARPLSTHNKFVVLDDDQIVLGSHNWTHRAFRESEEDSVAVVSTELNARLREEFLWAWTQSELEMVGSKEEGDRE